MRVDADVLVVGLGPAGGSAACAAARAGMTVVALERRDTIGLPVQCAELVPLTMSRQVRDTRVQTIEGMDSFLPSGRVKHSAMPGLMIDRAAFDRTLAEAAAGAGATLWPGSRLVALDAPLNRARVVTRQGECEIHYRTLIAADGPGSSVALRLGLPRQPVIHARQYTVPLSRPRARTGVWLSRAYPGGYAWLFPRGETANLGLGMDKRRARDIRMPLDQLHRRLVDQGMLGREILRRTGGAIPVGGLRARLCLGNILLAGDAGGFTHPVTGAGIHPAVTSGERAGAAAAAWLRGEHHALADFEQDMRDLFETSHRRALARRREAEFATHQGNDEDEQFRRAWVAFPEYFSS